MHRFLPGVVMTAECGWRKLGDSRGRKVTYSVHTVSFVAQLRHAFDGDTDVGSGESLLL